MTCGRAAGRVWRGAAAVSALVATLAAGACSDAAGPEASITGHAGEFAATNEYLASVAEATDGLTYRMSADMTMGFEGGGQELEVTGTYLTGEVDGGLFSMTVDMNEVAREFPGAASTGDVSMEFVSDGGTLYVRAPYFATTLAAMEDQGATPAELEVLAALAELDDEWGSIDLSQISVGEAASVSGAQSSDPRAYLDLAAEGRDVHELGSESIGGVDTRGIGASVTYADVLAAEGGDPDQLREYFSALFDDLASNEDDAEVLQVVIDEMFAVEMPVEVWVDADDRVRRIVLDVNTAEVMARATERLGTGPTGVGVSVVMTMDFTDYGADVDIEVPETAIDVTGEYQALIEDGLLGNASGG